MLLNGALGPWDSGESKYHNLGFGDKIDSALSYFLISSWRILVLVDYTDRVFVFQKNTVEWLYYGEYSHPHKWSWIPAPFP